MTLSELKALMGLSLVEDWQDEADAPDEMLQGFLDNGIPEEWARAFAKTFRSVPVSKWPRVLHSPRVLHKRLRGATVNSEMNTDHRQAISRSRPGDESFRKAIGRYTQNELAKAVGISPATLSFYRNGRKVPKKVADDVERLTGFKASAKNWPGGIHGE